jgi:hypothetical protein
MKYQHDKKPQRSKAKLLIWVLFVVLAVLYSLLVYSWIVEGNRNFELQRQEKASQL